MSRFLSRIRNAWPFLNAYSNVNTSGGEDLLSSALFSQLREFGNAEPESGPVPVALLMEFNTAQKRVKGRRKYRIGAGALFAGIVVVPGLAYAGVLPTPVARVVAHIVDGVSSPVQSLLDAVSIPVQLPSLSAEVEKDAVPTPDPVSETSQSPEPIPSLEGSADEELDQPSSYEGSKGENGGSGTEMDSETVDAAALGEVNSTEGSVQNEQDTPESKPVADSAPELTASQSPEPSATETPEPSATETPESSSN